MASSSASFDRSTAGTSPRQLSDTARAVISLLIFVHLFAVSLAFLGNFEGAEFDPKRSLVPAMKAVVRPYLVPLWLDRPLQNYLTYGAPGDFDHYIEVAITPTEASQETSTLRLPAEDAGAGPVAARYRRLAWHVARRAAFADSSALLPLAIGSGVLKQTGAAKVQVRCFRQQPIFLDALDGSATGPVPTADERVYAADVFFLPGLDQPQLNKVGEARDVAPVTGPSRSGGPAARPSGAKQGANQGGPSAGAPVGNPLLPGDNILPPPALPPALPSKNQ